MTALVKIARAFVIGNPSTDNVVSLGQMRDIFAQLAATYGDDHKLRDVKVDRLVGNSRYPTTVAIEVIE